MTENRIKLLKLLAMANAGLMLDVGDEAADAELDRIFNAKFSDLVQETIQAGGFDHDATFGEYVDELLKMMQMQN